MTDAELASQVAKADGRVFIGFKDSSAAVGVSAFGRVLVSPAAIATGEAAVRATGATIERTFVGMPTVVARIAAARLPALRHNPHVEYVEPIFPGVLDGQTIPWNIQQVGAPTAWTSSTGSGAKLLIIGTGVDTAQSDLAPAVIQSCVSPITDGIDHNGHGTEVAGVAAALNNAIKVVGVAPDVVLWSSQFGDSLPDPAAIACGIQFGRTNSVDVINISSSFLPYTAVTQQVNAAYYQDGIVVVAAAGNYPGGSHGAVTYPASLDAVIAVSATAFPHALASFSATGPKVELAAPGDNIPTTCLGDSLCTVSGTSFASPAVAAAAALLKSYNSAWSNFEIRARLDAGASDLGTSGRDSDFGWGFLNIPAAISANVPPISSVSIDGPTQIRPGATCTWHAVVSGGTAPYAYEWTNNGQFGGTDDSYTGSNNPGNTNSYFHLKVVVTGAYGLTGSQQITVNENASAPICFI